MLCLITSSFDNVIQKIFFSFLLKDLTQMDVPIGLTFPQYLKYHLDKNPPTYDDLIYWQLDDKPGTYFKVPWNHYSFGSENKMYTVSIKINSIFIKYKNSFFLMKEDFYCL